MKVAIIGGGASGMFAGGLIANKGHKVVIFDGNEKCGKKLYITGKGRCNFTNLCDTQTFLENVVRGRKFIQSALTKFSPQDCVDFFEAQGVKTKVERGRRVFPKSDKSSDIIKALERFCSKAEVRLNHKVKAISLQEGKFKVDNEIFDCVIIATGGKSYEGTGSTGDGYNFAKRFGHTIVPLKSALCAIELKDNLSSLQGVSLKNVSLNAVIEGGGKLSQFGEMLFTDKGISGPCVLTMSSLINRSTVKQLFIDFKPALTLEQIDNRLLREFDNAKNKNLSHIVENLLPKSLVAVFLEKLGLDGHKKVNSVTQQERKILKEGLKCWTVEYKMLYPLSSGVITSGGVDLKEVDPRTMQSKLVKGLYFIGEVLDIDALTGGYNLQIAFSTAYALSTQF